MIIMWLLVNLGWRLRYILIWVYVKFLYKNYIRVMIIYILRNFDMNDNIVKEVYLLYVRG